MDVTIEQVKKWADSIVAAGKDNDAALAKAKSDIPVVYRDVVQVELLRRSCGSNTR